MFYLGLLSGAAIGVAVWVGRRAEQKQRPVSEQSVVSVVAVACLGFTLWFGLWSAFVVAELYGAAADDQMWASVSPQGVSGVRTYLELYPEGRSAVAARVELLSSEYNTTVVVDETYKNVPQFTLGLFEKSVRQLYERETANVDVVVRVEGEALHESYERRGRLYTGASLAGDVRISSRCDGGEVLFLESFSFESRQTGSVYLLESDSGPDEPTDAPFEAGQLSAFIGESLDFVLVCCTVRAGAMTDQERSHVADLLAAHEALIH